MMTERLVVNKNSGEEWLEIVVHSREAEYLNGTTEEHVIRHRLDPKKKYLIYFRPAQNGWIATTVEGSGEIALADAEKEIRRDDGGRSCRNCRHAECSDMEWGSKNFGCFRCTDPFWSVIINQDNLCRGWEAKEGGEDEKKGLIPDADSARACRDGRTLTAASGSGTRITARGR